MKYCERCMTAFPDDFTVCPKDQSPLRASSDLITGMVLLGKYRILDKIGSGGMAVVYRARHVAFDELRAIKVVNSHLLQDAEFIGRFKTEAVITRKLQHANAVRVDDLEMTEDGRPFIVMEYVEGTNLRTLLHEKGALPMPRAISIARQVAAALGAAHKLGIVHRDIKPDNVLLVPQGDGDLVKVLDFGIAKMRTGGSDVNAGYTPTQTGMVVGTPQYISPEQAMGHKDIDGRSDLYSLGVVLYEMVVGRLPFQTEHPVEFLIAHMHTRPTPPDEAAPEKDIPPELSALIMKALDKDPNRRFQTAEQMEAALEKPMQSEGTSVLGSGTMEAAGDEASEGARRGGTSVLGSGAPTIAAGFILGKELAATSSSSVYQATDAATKKPIAVRLVQVNGRLMGREQMLAELNKSAAAARQLNAPNIVQVLGFGEHEGAFYIATELVEGILLRNTLAKGEPLPLSEVTDIGRQACLAFEHAHSKGVVHGNMHPGNILAEWDGTIKILDFGVAVFPDDQNAGAKRLAYTAPEHAGGDPADPKADLFSLGAVLYQMATGRAPFAGNEPAEVMNKLLNETPEPPHSIDARIHPGLSKVILKALAKSPEERYQNASELLRDLENYKSLVTETPAEGPKTGSFKAAAATAGAARSAGVAPRPRVPTPVPSAKPAVPAKPELVSALETAAAPAAPAPGPPAPASIGVKAPASKPTTTSPVARLRPVAPPPPKGLSKNVIVGGVAALLLVVVLIGGYFVVFRHPAPAPPTAQGSATSGIPEAGVTEVQPGTETTSPGESRPAAGRPRSKKGAGTIAPDTTTQVAAIGQVALATTPSGASIQLDGRPTAWTTPYTVAGIGAGNHTVTFTRAGYAPETRDFSVTANQTFFLSVPLKGQGALMSIGSDPPGAAILIDGNNTGKVTPADFVWPKDGAHSITLHKDGYLDASTSASLQLGQPYHYSATLLQAGNTSNIKTKGVFGGRPATMGGLKIETRPKGAQIIINGQTFGKKTPVELNLDPGNYQVTVQMPGYKPVTSVVQIVVGETAHISEDLEKQ